MCTSAVFSSAAASRYPTFWAMLATTIVLRSIYHDGVPMRALLCELFRAELRARVMGADVVARRRGAFLPSPGAGILVVQSEPSHVERRALKWAVGLLVAVFAIRVATQLLVPHQYKMTAWVTRVRIDSLAFGMVLSYLQHCHPERLRSFVLRRRHWLATAGVAMVLHVLFFDAAGMFVSPLAGRRSAQRVSCTPASRRSRSACSHSRRDPRSASTGGCRTCRCRRSWPRTRTEARRS